jgi:hypothetical protein
MVPAAIAINIRSKVAMIGDIALFFVLAESLFSFKR